MTLQAAITGGAAAASSLATYGASFWQDTACSYSFVQNYIGYCPTICDKYFPQALVGICQTALPYVEMVGADNLFYGTLAVATAGAGAYTAWKTYNTNPTPEIHVQNHLHVHQIEPKVLQEIMRQLTDLQAQMKALQEKMDTLTPEEQEVEVDLIQRARDQLEGYLNQRDMDGYKFPDAIEFIGDNIRKMGIELLEKAKREPLVKDRDTVAANEEKRLDKTLAAKEAQTKARQEERKAKTPAFDLAKKQATASSSADESRAALLQDIKAKGGQKKVAVAGMK